ncbi:MAG: hypothetical protein VXX70_04695 [Bacteroidota bacterium]|nr:hypothetical protein [Bacteroidota bacterium]
MDTSVWLSQSKATAYIIDTEAVGAARVSLEALNGFHGVHSPDDDGIILLSMQGEAAIPTETNDIKWM